MPELNADVIISIAALAKSAAGNLDSALLAPPKHAVGLPAEVPALIRAGASPALVGLRDELEKWRTAPERRSGTAAVTTLRAFIDLTVRHRDDHSALFARTQWPEPSLTAVIDYHQTDGVARFCKHRVHYAFPLTPEFQRWIKANEEGMGQHDFAEFVEDNVMDMAAATDAEVATYEKLFRTKFALPSELIDLARGLEISVDSRVKQVVRLQSGEVSIAFDTEHKNGAGEALTVPGLFMVSLRAFVDGSEVRMPARLRYRVKDRAVNWMYSLYKWEDVLRERVAADAEFAAAETALPCYEGAPEA